MQIFRHTLGIGFILLLTHFQVVGLEYVSDGQSNNCSSNVRSGCKQVMVTMEVNLAQEDHILIQLAQVERTQLLVLA